MATVDNITVFATGTPSLELVRCQLTGTTSTYVTRKFSNVAGYVLEVEGTNATTSTRSTKTITITGTNDDWVNIILWGNK